MPDKRQFFVAMLQIDARNGLPLQMDWSNFYPRFFHTDDPLRAGSVLVELTATSHFTRALENMYAAAHFVPGIGQQAFKSVVCHGDVLATVYYWSGVKSRPAPPPTVTYVRYPEINVTVVPYDEFAVLPSLFVNADAVANMML
jgi:hypothetical protein